MNHTHFDIGSERYYLDNSSPFEWFVYYLDSDGARKPVDRNTSRKLLWKHLTKNMKEI